MNAAMPWNKNASPGLPPCPRRTSPWTIAWLGAFLALFCAPELGHAADASKDKTEASPTPGIKSYYIANREPLVPSAFVKLPIGAIQPKGWLKHQLELEARGMTGRLPEVSKW